MEDVAGIASCQVCTVVTDIGLCQYVFTHSIKAGRSCVAVFLQLSFSSKTVPLLKMHSTAL
jgi:hypothetical protein